MSQPSSPTSAPSAPDALGMRDTIASSDLPQFSAFLSKSRGDDTFKGYDVNIDGMVAMSVYDADTHEIIDREVFGQNGLAQEYIDQEEEMMDKNKDSGWWAAPEDEDDDQEDKDGRDNEGEVTDDTREKEKQTINPSL